jgi:hypothetical protein
LFLRLLFAWLWVHAPELVRVVVSQLLQVEAPTSAEPMRHEVCKPVTLMPELETPPRRLSPMSLPASRTGRTQGPRSGLRAKSCVFATALTRPSTGRFWAQRWAFGFIPEYL